MRRRPGKILVIALLAVLLYAISGCGKKAENASVEKYRFSDMEDGCTVLRRGEDVIFPYEDRIWSGGEKVPLGYYDRGDGMRFHEVSDLRAVALTVREDGVFICTTPQDGEQEIAELGFDGTVLHRWPVPADPGSVRRNYRIAAGDGWILLIYNSYKSANEPEAGRLISCVTVSRSRGTVTSRSLTGGKTATDVMGAEPEGEVFLRTATMPDRVLAAEWKGGSEFVIETLYSDLYGSLTGELYVLDAARGTMKYRGGTDYFQLADIADGTLYGFSSPSFAWCQFSRWAEDGPISLRSLGTETILKRVSDALGEEKEEWRYTDLFFTGTDFLLWDAWYGTLNVFDAITEDERCLTVLCPVSEKGSDDYDKRVRIKGIPFASSWFETENDCLVQTVSYPVTEFADRLRMKLLAGDTDFDVVWADKCDRGDLLSAILRYGLYLPLEESPGILANMEAYADGVRDFMTRDGHVFGSPVSFESGAFVVGKDFRETGLTIPDSGWTLDNFWTLCEEAAPFCHDGCALAPQAQIWILSFFSENSVRAGAVEPASLCWIMEKLADYHSRGILVNYPEAETFLLTEIPVPAQSQIWREVDPSEDPVVIPYPAAEGKRYAPLTSFVFINPKTTKPELSLAYLSMLTGPDFAPCIEGEKTLFMKDPDSYFTWVFGDGWTPSYEKNRWTKEPFQAQGSVILAASATEEVFHGTEVCICDSAELRGMIRELTDRLFAGELTPADAAEEFAGAIRYRYFE